MFKIVIHDAMSSLRMRLENRHVSALMMMRGIINEALVPGRMTIWAWDGKGGNDRRRAIFPGYKNRPPTPSDMHAALGMLRELLKFTPAWQAQADGYEGDDMVATLVEHFRGQYPIEIITRDGDLTGLCGPGVTCKAPAPVPPDLIRLYKLTVGDPSDTIPGVSGFGKGSWAKCNHTLLGRVMDDFLFNAPVSDNRAAEAGLQPRHINWIRDNHPTLLAMHQIIQPMLLTPEEFNAALSQGVDNPAAREAVLKEFLQ